MNSSAARPAPLDALTGIRFLAALHVVLYHYAGELFAPTHWTVRALIAAGPSAVGLFYVLSGVVLTYSCTNGQQQLTGSARSFWAARFARIYPTYLLALVLDAPFFASALLKAHDGPDVLLWGVIVALPVLLLLHAWTPVTVFVWNIPGWSISAEAFFYAMFPSVVRRLRARETRELLASGALFYACALLAPLIVLAAEFWDGSILTARFPGATGPLDLHTWLVRLAGFSPIARFPEFLIGICLGRWLSQRRALQVSPRRAAMHELTALAALGLAWVILGSRPAGKLWIDSGLLAPVFVLLIAALAAGSGPFARLLSSPVLQALGHASYALYILQQPVLIWTARVQGFGSLPAHIFVPIFVGTLIAASLVSQRYFGEPVRLWLVRRRAKDAPAPGGAVPVAALRTAVSSAARPPAYSTDR